MVMVFGAVGVAATVTHVLLALALTGFAGMRPFEANALGYLAGFLVSYSGHHRVTYRSSAAHRRALPRFLAVSGGGLVLNQLIVYAVVNVLGLSYGLALAIILATVPALTFMAGRYWAFAEGGGRT
jgi:putative flippase GtrA